MVQAISLFFVERMKARKNFQLLTLNFPYRLIGNTSIQ